MVELPSDILVNSLSSEKFSIIWFEDRTIEPPHNKHYHVSVSINSDQFLILCMITSKVQKREAHYERRGKSICKTCLVPIDQNSFSFLTKESVIECNQPILLTRADLLARLAPKSKLKIIARDGSFKDTLKKEIVAAIQKSPLVKPLIKAYLNPLIEGDFRSLRSI